MADVSAEGTVGQDSERSLASALLFPPPPKSTEQATCPPEAEGRWQGLGHKQNQNSSSEANSAIPTLQKDTAAGTRELWPGEKGTFRNIKSNLEIKVL